MKAKPTVYAGIEFRSRLEAKWACFFDELGWRWTYEPFDGNGYIPDFLIHGDSPLLVEVKPAVSLADYRAPIPKMIAGLSGQWPADLLIVGADPLPAWEHDGRDGCLAGLFGQSGPCACGHDDEHPHGEYLDESGKWWSWDTGNWTFTFAHSQVCCECGALAVYRDYAPFVGRPCGHRHRGRFPYGPDWQHPIMDGYWLGPFDGAEVRTAWAAACNATKWRPGGVA
jgi:hypothetical protein